MSILTANKLIEEFLGQARDATEIRNPEGKVLGHFTPVDGTLQEFYEAARIHFSTPESRAERLHRSQAGRPGYSFAEVLQHLESLESP